MIGINAVVLENAEIGDNCVVGAGSVVLADTIIPSESVVIGVPGRVRPLKEEYRKRIEAGVTQYRENARRFKSAGLGMDPPQD